MELCFMCFICENFVRFCSVFFDRGLTEQPFFKCGCRVFVNQVSKILMAATLPFTYFSHIKCDTKCIVTRLSTVLHVNRSNKILLSLGFISDLFAQHWLHFLST